jgi:hypothetical protein
MPGHDFWNFIIQRSPPGSRRVKPHLRFLTWYHDHPFEIDQRGLHIFLALPAQVEPGTGLGE